MMDTQAKYPDPPDGWTWRFGRFSDGWTVVARKTDCMTTLPQVESVGHKTIDDAAKTAREKMQ